jgi:glycosyltransferase involved in cell wall biosynthesis
MRSTLVLVTGSFPHPTSAEHSFIQPELALISKRFERVIILPRDTRGAATTVPDRCIVDRSFGDARRHSKHRFVQRARGLCSSLPLAPALVSAPNTRSVRGIRQSLWTASEAGLARDALLALVHTRRLDPRDTLVYTYWFDEFTTGALLARASLHGIKVVSRAHGFDVYEERHDPPFIPFREWSLARIDQLMSVSDRGRDYLICRYPRWANKIVTSRLGVEKPPRLAQPSADGALRVLSCSSIIPLKRVWLIAEAICVLAQRVRVLWTHIGDGPERALVEAIAHRVKPPSHCIFTGQVTPDAVRDFYFTQPVDVFVNASTTEGVPVSIMEAMSFGVPVVATDVGGTGELVNSRNGALLVPNPTPAEIADAILRTVHDRAAKSRATLDTFDDRIDAARVHERTVALLSAH